MKSLWIAWTFLVAFTANASDWSQFLGPHRNGILADETFVQAWLKTGIQEQWQVPIGEGYSGISVHENQLFTMDSNGKEEFVVAFQATDGRQLWRTRTGTSPNDVYGGLGPRVTPSVDRDLVFTVSAQGELIALYASNGRIAWKRSLAPDLGWRPPAEGTAASPLVQDGRIYLIIGGANGKAFAAFDRNTGKTIWTSQDDRTSYSSAVRWDFAGIKQVLFLSGSNLFSLDANNGRLLWKYPWPTYDYVNVATPLILPPDRVFISAGYDQGAAMLRVQKNKTGNLQVTEIWRNREMKNHFNNSVFHNEVIYGFDNAILKAVDARTGNTLWRERGFGKGSIIRTGDYLLILSESGELACAKADPKSWNLLKRVQALKGKSWTPASVATGRVFLRNTSELSAFAPLR